MTHIWQGLQSGQWLTSARARGYSLILLGIYAAGSLVLDGRAADVYNMAAHYAREQQIFGASTPYYGFLYPPIFLLVAAPLALLPYPLALAAWQISTFALYLSV